MKNLKLISLALVIVSSSLFASNSIKVDFITINIQPVPKKVFTLNTTIEKDKYQNFEIKENEESDLIIKNFNKVNYVLNAQEKQNYINLQNQAARNYSYNLRSEIISKE